MLSKSIALFLFLIFSFLKKTSTKNSSRNPSTDIPYLFTGITLYNGSRVSGVEVELQNKKESSKRHVIISKNTTDKYGVFTFETLVKNETKKNLILNFYYNCSLKKQCHYSKKKPYSVNVSFLNCPWDSSTEGIKCELKAELQNITVGTVRYPSISLFSNITREKYEIEKWDIQNNISFFIAKKFDNFSRVDERIINITKEIENNTCIIFQQQDKKKSEGHGIIFRKSNECKNMRIGIVKKNAPQAIYLTEECAASTRTIRSLLHQALGQLASVFREDRIEYVDVDLLYMNLSRIDSFNYTYTYRTENNYTGNFDFGSITLLNSSAFSVDKSKKIIKPIVSYDNYYDNMMGKIEEPSFYDYKFLNKYYCMDKCKNETNCPDPCYQNPKNCSACVCPTGYELSGKYMYYIYGDEKVCGYEDIYASERLQHIVISNITYCLYHMDIQGHNGHVFVRFPDFRGMFLSEECSWNNSIEIRFRKKIDHLGICLCYNKDIEAPEIVSEGKHMVVIFNFQIYRSYVHLEFMKVNSTNFEYKNLEEYQKIPRLLKKECNKKHDAPHDKCN